MKEVSVKFILAYATQIAGKNKTWHFHLLTPDCVFNTKKDFALVLEDSKAGITYINHSGTKQEVEGKILLELLHGIKADEKKHSSGKVSPAAKKIATRAKQLTKKSIPWHHHALFPDCVYNKSVGNWVVMLEDSVTGKVLESISKEKPDADLQLIEPLFYHQKK